jgi:long-chain-alcohol oxidase
VGVEGTLLDADRKPRGTARILADRVVVAGGAIETPYLLLRSGVDDPSGQLGHNLFLHPATAVVGIFPERIAMWEGIKQGYYISEFSWVLEEHPADVLLEGVAGPPGLVSTLFPGWGEERRVAFAAQLEQMAGTGVLVRDHDPGRVEVGPNRPKVHYTLSEGDTRRLREGMLRTAEAYFAAGATEVATTHTPPLRLKHPRDVLDIWDRGCGAGQINLFTFHQMGTARMGGRKDRDVVDPTGRLWRYRNLHVADSSVFPTASGVNPQLTVYGLSHLISDGILAELGSAS